VDQEGRDVAKRGAKREQLDADGLTPRQRLFCLEYLSNGFVGAAAARSAGYSERCAAQQALENLAKPAVKAFLEPRMRATVKKLELRAELLDERLAAIAYRDLDPALLQDPETGEARSLDEIPEDQRKAIAGVKIRELWSQGTKDKAPEQIGRVVEFKLVPDTARVSAIELSYKRLGILREKLDVTTTLSHEQLLVLAQRIRERKAAARAGAAVGKPAAPARGKA
jgi:phage terminase small subunit